MFQDPLHLATLSLTGLSIGDAFGERFFGPEEEVLARIAERQLPDGPWEFTDDTVMSIAVLLQLQRNGRILQDEFAADLVKLHDLDPMRGYGATARRILREIGEGSAWREVSAGAFDGMGSMGNGAAMRSAPVGAFFAQDMERVVAEARLAAEVTHYHPEGVEGAVAVAVAAALAAREKLSGSQYSGLSFLDRVRHELQPSEVRSRIGRAITLRMESPPTHVASVLGNGTEMTAQDTVPAAMWVLAHHRHHFEDALWAMVSLLGDRDTLCAIVGGVAALACAREDDLPWRGMAEDWRTSPFYLSR